jgi:hypothetical protein
MPVQPPSVSGKQPATGKGVVVKQPNSVPNGGQHLPKTGK